MCWVCSTCLYGEPPATHHQRGWRCQRRQLLSCRAARQQVQVLGRSRARSRQRWHEDPKEGSFLAVTAEGFATTSQLGKRGALAKRRCPVAGVLGCCCCGPRLTMGFRDLDATKKCVRCNMTANTSAYRIASRKLGKPEPGKLSFCAPEPEFVSSAWQLLFPCTEEPQSIKICCVAGSRPRGGPMKRSQDCAKKGYAGRMVEEASTLSPRRL